MLGNPDGVTVSSLTVSHIIYVFIVIISITITKFQMGPFLQGAVHPWAAAGTAGRGGRTEEERGVQVRK